MFLADSKLCENPAEEEEEKRPDEARRGRDEDAKTPTTKNDPRTQNEREAKFARQTSKAVEIGLKFAESLKDKTEAESERPKSDDSKPPDEEEIARKTEIEDPKVDDEDAKIAFREDFGGAKPKTSIQTEEKVVEEKPPKPLDFRKSLEETLKKRNPSGSGIFGSGPPSRSGSTKSEKSVEFRNSLEAALARRGSKAMTVKRPEEETESSSVSASPTLLGAECKNRASLGSQKRRPPSASRRRSSSKQREDLEGNDDL